MNVCFSASGRPRLSHNIPRDRWKTGVITSMEPGLEPESDAGIPVDATGLDLQMEPRQHSPFEQALGKLALDVAGALCTFAKELGYNPQEVLFPPKPVAKGKKGGDSDKPRRRREPSDYNRYVSETVKEIKAERPDIQMKEAFKLAGERWKEHKAKHGIKTSQPHVSKKRRMELDSGDYSNGPLPY